MLYKAERFLVAGGIKAIQSGDFRIAGSIDENQDATHIECMEQIPAHGSRSCIQTGQTNQPANAGC